MSDKVKEILENLSDEEREKVKSSLSELEGADQPKEDKEKEDKIEKLADAIVKATGAGQNKKTEAKVSDDDEELKKAMHSFSKETDSESVDKLVKDARMDKEERLMKYQRAKEEGNTGYIKRVNKRVAKYFEALVQGNTPVVRALTEGTDSEGGFLVPEEFRAELIEELENVSVMRQIATVIPMGTDTLDIPKLSASPKAYWTSEDATITTSSAEFGELTLSPNKLIGRLPWTRELNSDSAIAMVNLLTRKFADTIGEQEDKAFFTGDGSGKPKGLDQETLSSVNASGASNKADELINLKYLLKRAYRPNAVWVMNSKTLRNINKLKDDNGQYVVQTDFTADSPARVLGARAYEQNDLADGKIFYGDFSFYYVGDREQVSVETTTEGGTAWDRDRIELKVRERVDGKTALTSAFVEGTNF